MPNKTNLDSPDNYRVFETGSLIIARELWDGLLWAARPVIVVTDDDDELVHWSPAGTIGCFATSRFFPGRENLPRDERQLAALRTKQWHYQGLPSRGAKLTFIRNHAWVGVEATWNRDGTFAHWYVNFQLPPTRTSTGYDTLDLVLDITVAPDWSWTWKDQDPFQVALREGIFDHDRKGSAHERGHSHPTADRNALRTPRPALAALDATAGLACTNPARQLRRRRRYPTRRRHHPLVAARRLSIRSRQVSPLPSIRRGPPTEARARLAVLPLGL
jgi:hypothetical protein